MGLPTGNLGIPNWMAIIPGMTAFTSWFMKKKIDEELLFSKKTGNEEIVITDAVVYLYCPHGYGGTKLNNNFLESKLKVQATTRNWKTTLKLLDMIAENTI